MPDQPRPDSACLTCPPPRAGRAWRLADAGYKTCSDCLDGLRSRLAEIAKRWSALDPSPGAQGPTGRGAPGFGSRSPASDHVIAMRDLRSSRVARVWLGADGRVHRETTRPPLSVTGELYTLAYHVAEIRDVAMPVVTVASLVRWLDTHLDWITRQPGVVEVDRVVRDLTGQLRPVTGEPGAKRVGVCPNTLDEGEHTRECGAPLYAPLKGDTIVCQACERPWPRPEWEELGKMLQAAS